MFNVAHFNRLLGTNINMSAASSLATKLADDIEAFELGRCGPSDDLDKQYAYTSAFRDVAKRFISAVKRIGDPDLSSLVAELSSSPADIVEAHELRAELFVVIDALKEAAQNPDFGENVSSNSAYLDREVLIRLKAVRGANLDTKKLVRMCEELNDAYSRANYISTALILRAILNHVPPVFGVTSFSQVVSNSDRSLKSILTRLEEDARPIADLHTHIRMREVESLPTKNQLEPYRAPFELLMQEILVRVSGNGT